MYNPLTVVTNAIQSYENFWNHTKPWQRILGHMGTLSVALLCRRQFVEVNMSNVIQVYEYIAVQALAAHVALAIGLGQLAGAKPDPKEYFDSLSLSLRCIQQDITALQQDITAIKARIQKQFADGV